MLVTSTFFLTYNVFKNLSLQGRKKSGLCGKELKSMRRNEKMLGIIIFYFSIKVVSFPKTNFNFSVTIILLPGNAFNVNQ